MKIAVLMSTFNGEKYIEEQIESILAQRGDFQLDLWVRDDGSQDKTQEILEKYSKQGKLFWYTGEKLYAAHSFIDLLLKCKGYDYYAFADQDDYWMSEKIQIGVNSLLNIENSYPALYFANAELVGCNLEFLGRVVYKSIPKTDFKTMCCAGGYLGCTMVFNSSLAKLIQKKPMPGKIIMHDFYLAEVCAGFHGKIVFDKKVCMKYRQHSDNVVGVKKGSIQKLIHEIYTKESVSIADQAESILNGYSDMLPNDSIQWFEKIKDYKKSFKTRMSLAVTKCTKYMNCYASFRLRLQILFGNR